MFFYKTGSTGSITMDHANWFRRREPLRRDANFNDEGSLYTHF